MRSRSAVLLLTIVVSLAGCGKRSVTTSRENLTKIGMALHDHHDTFGYLPCVDRNVGRKPEDAKVGLSWRVHLLPYLGQSELHHKFNFDEPWDGPNNSKLIAEMPAVFRSAGTTKLGETSFHVLLSPDPNKRFLFNNPDFVKEVTADGYRKFAVTFSDVTDGTSNTIMVVEAGPSTAHPWTKPGGLVVELLHPKKVLAQPNDSMLILVADGKVRSISQKKVSDATMLELLTRDAGEAMEQLRPVTSVKNPIPTPTPSIQQRPSIAFPGAPSLAESLRSETIAPKPVNPHKLPDLELPVSSAPELSVLAQQTQSEVMRSTVLKLEGKDIVEDIVWSPEGDAFFTLTQQGVLSRITNEDFIEQKRLDLGRKCSFLTLSGQGLLVAVTDLQEVWMIDPQELKVTGRIPVPSVTRVLSGPTLKLAVAVSREQGIRDGIVTILDLIKKQPVTQYAIVSRNARITPDGKHYFARGGIEQLKSYKIDELLLSPGQSTDRIAANGKTICVSPDSKYVCLPSGGGNYGTSYGTYVYAVDNLIEPKFTVDSGPYPQLLGFDPVGENIFAHNSDFQLLVYTTTGSLLKEIKFNRSEDPRQFVAHPKGNKLLVLTNQLYFVELDKVK